MDSYTPDTDVLQVSEIDGQVLFPMYHGGEWQAAVDGATLPVVNPATGVAMGVIAEAGSPDVEAAYTSAEAGQKDWARLSAAERSQRCHEIADRIEAHVDALARLEAASSGNPVTAMRRDVLKGAEVFRQMGGLGNVLTGDTVPVMQGALHCTRREPYGVVARIVAFNHPFLFACGRIATGLVAGNAVILKPSELTSLSALALAKVCDGVLPRGLLAVLTGAGALGAALTQHPDIQRISFTGSLGTALRIIEQGAKSGNLKHMSFELGGKNPMIVFPDADLDQAARAAVRGMNFAAVQGQSCGSTSRLYVHESIKDEMVERVVKITRDLRVGLPTDPDTDVGCLITPAARDRCIEYVEDAVRAGAQVACGGTAPDDERLAQGGFMNPTVLVDIPDTARAAREEIFGPVLSVLTWVDVDDVIARANSLPYGLTSAVWTKDLEQAFKVADALQAGYVWVNEVERRHYGIAFGGWKDSGMGAEYGLEEALSLMRSKTLVVNYGGLS